MPEYDEFIDWLNEFKDTIPELMEDNKKIDPMKSQPLIQPNDIMNLGKDYDPKNSEDKVRMDTNLAKKQIFDSLEIRLRRVLKG